MHRNGDKKDQTKTKINLPPSTESQQYPSNQLSVTNSCRRWSVNMYTIFKRLQEIQPTTGKKTPFIYKWNSSPLHPPATPIMDQ